MTVKVSNRASQLPVGAICYWRSGLLDQHSLPAGLLREHRLKEGTWGVLNLRSGAIEFTWDDEGGGKVELSAPAKLVVPPAVPHHVDIRGPFTLEIEFQRLP